MAKKSVFEQKVTAELKNKSEESKKKSDSIEGEIVEKEKDEL